MSVEINYREASYDDGDQLYLWRNDQLTRTMSVSTKSIDIDSHREWLKKTLSGDTRKVFIAYLSNGLDIGTVRVDSNEGTDELSWTIAPEQRGKGYGRQMVEQFLLKFPGTYDAIVKKENAASMKIVRGLGFRCIESDSVRRWQITV